MVAYRKAAQEFVLDNLGGAIERSHMEADGKI